MIRAISTALVAVFLCLPAAAQECAHPAVVLGQTQARVPTARILEILHGDAAQVVIAAFNEIPPRSEFKASHVAVVWEPRFPTVFLIAYTGDCLSFADEMPRDMYDALRKSGV
jgi:hypothetical protein